MSIQIRVQRLCQVLRHFPHISRGMLPSLKGNRAKGIACHDYLRLVLRQVKMPVFGASKMRVTQEFYDHRH